MAELKDFSGNRGKYNLQLDLGAKLAIAAVIIAMVIAVVIFIVPVFFTGNEFFIKTLPGYLKPIWLVALVYAFVIQIRILWKRGHFTRKITDNQERQGAVKQGAVDKNKKPLAG